MAHTPKIPGWIQAFLAADLGLGLMYVVMIGIGGPDKPLSWLFDLNRESSLTTWYASMQLFLVGCMLLLFVGHEFRRTRPHPWLLWLLPAAFLALSVDEVAMIHEWAGRKLDEVFMPGGDRAGSAIFRGTGIWPLALPIPFVLFMILLYFRLREHFLGCQRAVKRFAAGLGLLIAGAAGVEMVYNFIPWNGVAQLLQILFEEVMELGGATLMLWGAWDLLRSRGFKVHFGEFSSAEPARRALSGAD